jgi:hypothetical protein
MKIRTYVVDDLGEIGWGGMDWIDLARDRDQWRAIANTVITPSHSKTNCEAHE